MYQIYTHTHSLMWKINSKAIVLLLCFIQTIERQLDMGEKNYHLVIWITHKNRIFTLPELYGPGCTHNTINERLLMAPKKLFPLHTNHKQSLSILNGKDSMQIQNKMRVCVYITGMNGYTKKKLYVCMISFWCVRKNWLHTHECTEHSKFLLLTHN